jgi:DNA-binding winged helix-turn-helix (wHTH) protein/tetratricopeptide (TPR) repeat protein
MTNAVGITFRFGPYLLDLARRELTRDGEPIALTPRVFDVFVALVRRSGSVVTKDELLDEVWPGVFVGEANLTQSVSVLRKALGEADASMYIKTVPKRGYVFTGPVEHAEPTGAGAPPRLPTIAVLPFRLGGGTEAESFLSIGIADSLITKLGHARSVLVRPTSTVLRYDDETQDALVAGRALGVEYVLSGSVLFADGKVRVTVRLMNVAEEAVCWTHGFDVTCANVLAVENAVVRRVIDALWPSLSDGKLRKRVRFYTRSGPAYREYLKGRYHLSQRTADGFIKAADAFSRAIAIDPDYALAYVGVADAYSLPATYTIAPPSELMPRAMTALERALELDDTLAEAHTSLAYAQTHYDWNWEAAECSFRRAIGLDPKHAEARLWHGQLLTAMGAYDEAVEELRLAVEFAPLSLIVNTNFGWGLHWARRFDLAVEQLLATIELEPLFHRAYYNLGRTYLAMGKLNEALDALETSRSLNETTYCISTIGYVRGARGETAEARKALAWMEERAAQTYVAPYWFGETCLGLGEFDRAVAHFEAAADDRNWFLIFGHCEALLDPLRGHPGFEAVLRRVGLPV